MTRRERPRRPHRATARHTGPSMRARRPSVRGLDRRERTSLGLVTTEREATDTASSVVEPPVRTHRWGFGAFLFVFAVFVLSAVVIGAIVVRDRPARGQLRDGRPGRHDGAHGARRRCRAARHPAARQRPARRPAAGRSAPTTSGPASSSACWAWSAPRSRRSCGRTWSARRTRRVRGRRPGRQHAHARGRGGRAVPVRLAGRAGLRGDHLPRAAVGCARAAASGAAGRCSALTTVIFAVSHLEPLRTSLLLVIGIPIGLARLFTGRLGASIVPTRSTTSCPRWPCCWSRSGSMPA